MITTIVIHATDGGTLGGNVWWLSGGHSHASAHYVVSRDGTIVQLVHLSDIAWHAGNSKVNRHSIGIEHVGETYDPNGFTTEEYQLLRAARRLAREPLRDTGRSHAHHRPLGRSGSQEPRSSSAAPTTTPTPVRTGGGVTT